MIDLIDLAELRFDCVDLPDLKALLKQLITRPFQFFKISYGDELRLHLGDLIRPVNPRLRGSVRGSYIVGARASTWLIASAPHKVIATSDDVWLPPSDRTTTATRIDTKSIETERLIDPGSVVRAARADHSPSGFSLTLEFSDGSVVFIQPTPETFEHTPLGEEQPSGNSDMEISDWEVLTPHHRILRVGPGRRWNYLDSAAKNRAD